MSNGETAGIVSDAFGSALAAAGKGEEDFFVTLESRQDADKWIQITGHAINAAYPLKNDPAAELTRRGFTFPRSVGLASWEAGTFATFEHRGEPLSELVAFVERYSREILGVEPSESGYIVSTEV